MHSAAQNRQTHEKVAIKHIDRVLADKADTIRIIRELRFLRLLQHPNIIAVHDVLLPSARTAFDSIYIVFELLDTDLSHLIRSKTKYDEVHIQVRRSERTGLAPLPDAVDPLVADQVPGCLVVAVVAVPALRRLTAYTRSESVSSRPQAGQHISQRQL